MINRLRKQFILVAMCSTFMVLAIIIGMMNLFNYQTMTARVDSVLNMLAENDGRFPDNMFDKKEFHTEENAGDGPVKNFPRELDGQKRNSKDFFSSGDMEKKFFREMPYETRFFFILTDHQGNIELVDTGKVAAIESQEAAAYAEMVRETFLKKGIVRDFLNDYRYLIVEKESGSMILFVDAAREMENARNILIISIMVSLSGLLAIFFLVVFFFTHCLQTGGNQLSEAETVYYRRQPRTENATYHYFRKCGSAGDGIRGIRMEPEYQKADSEDVRPCAADGGSLPYG